MSYTIHDCEQRTPEWFAARLGRLTASDAKEAFSAVKSGEAAGRVKVRCKIVVERLTGVSCEDSYTNAAMQRGLDHEEEARSAYEALTGILVEPCGFVAHDDLMIGCSPDGVIDGLAAGVELKVPLLHTHVGYLRGKAAVPSAYVPQILHSLFVTDAAWWDFVSFAPELPGNLRTFHVRVKREDVDLKAHEAAVLKFLAECDEEERALLTLANTGSQLRASLEALA